MLDYLGTVCNMSQLMSAKRYNILACIDIHIFLLMYRNVSDGQVDCCLRPTK